MTTGPVRPPTPRPAVPARGPGLPPGATPSFRSRLPAWTTTTPAGLLRPADAPVRARGTARHERGAPEERPSPKVSVEKRSRSQRAYDLDPELAPFRPMPAVLVPPPPPPAFAPIHAARAQLAQIAEHVVTRLRVGRVRDGAVVELRLSLGGREHDVRLVETPNGIALETPDEALHAALGEELARRGIALDDPR